MSFFAPFSEAEKDLFRTASTQLSLARGDYLMRRGEPGGDVFLVEDGALEVVDRRALPEVVLASLPPGAVVGEMSFLEDSPRSADVRATEDSRVRRWAREDLRGLLAREPVVAARFFEAVARMASTRIRNITTDAVTGSIGRQEASQSIGIERVRAEVLALADRVKDALLLAEQSMRSGDSVVQAGAMVGTTLDALERDVRMFFEPLSDAEVATEAARLLGRELHPYLVRSALGDRCIRKGSGAGQAEVLAHVLVDSASGEGQLGELIDRWLLDRPTFQSLRGVREALVAPVQAHLPDHRNRRILVLNAGTGSLIASLGNAVGAAPTVLTVVDPGREALAFLDAGVALRPRKVKLRTIQHSLVQLALGRFAEQLPPQDAIVIHGLLEYMPDRIVLSLLHEVRSRLVPDGLVVASALAPSDDAVLLDRVLGWPTVRRRAERLERLFVRAGLRPQESAPRSDVLLTVQARAAD